MIESNCAEVASSSKSQPLTTAEIRPYENPRALQGRTVFNRYLGNGKSESKVEKRN